MLTVNESGLYSLIFTSRKPEAKRFRKWVTNEVLPAIRQTGRYVDYSENDPDPILVWSKLLGVRPSDVITKGFDIGYLTGGPINPSDYLAHNHRVLCYMVTGLSSSWEGCTRRTSIRVGRDANGRRDSSPSNSRSPTGSPSGSSKPTRPRRPSSDASITPPGRPGQSSATWRRTPAFLVRADGRETFLSNKTEVFDHDRSTFAEARQLPCGASPDRYERRARQPTRVRQQANAGAERPALQRQSSQRRGAIVVGRGEVDEAGRR